MSALVLLASLLGYHNGIGRLDLVLYDKAIQLNHQPARDDIVIVAIDDYSIAQLGKWPWPRERHAQLFEKINQAKPSSVGFDVLFNEPETDSISDGSTNADNDLANTIAANKVTVLPITLESAGAGLVVSKPLPMMQNAARSLGHINLEIDSDGFARSIFLAEGRPDEWWPHFSLAMFNIIKKRPLTDTSLISTAHIKQRAPSTSDSWLRDAQFHIPFYGNQGTFKSVPYVSVLRGEAVSYTHLTLPTIYSV